MRSVFRINSTVNDSEGSKGAFFFQGLLCIHAPGDSFPLMAWDMGYVVLSLGDYHGKFPKCKYSHLVQIRKKTIRPFEVKNFDEVGWPANDLSKTSFRKE